MTDTQQLGAMLMALLSAPLAFMLARVIIAAWRGKA